MDATEILQRIPQVDAVLRDPSLREPAALLGHAAVARIVRDELDRVRAAAGRGVVPPDAAGVAESCATLASALHRARLQRVVNATGVVLHTNLGRAPLGDAALNAIAAAAGASNVEYDLAAGERRGRAPLASFLAAALTGAESALVVNNNAGALLLLLAGLAKGREVVVSRGELIEIGGEFRLPSIMEASGAILREVGTTNRTHARDYGGALSERTAMILAVHPSNFRVVGFTAAPALDDLAAIAREAGVPLVHDIGSGLIEPDERWPDEPAAASSLRHGADLVCFSGDKLLGGPQAGVIAGRKPLVDACRRHPIARAVRADKLTLAAMEATLLAHARGEPAALPVHAMLGATVDDLRARASAIAARIPHATVGDADSVAGGGSTPQQTIPSVAVRVPAADPAKAAAALRDADPPVVARIEGDALVLDLRTVAPADDDHVLATLKSLSRPNRLT